jgi:acetyl-CoA carboxylase biotin carboxylase subunit
MALFNKVLIANRGEIAMRVIRACKELGIKTVAVYSTADKESLHLKFADEAVCIGPPVSKDSYLSIPNIISAAEITNADAIHPGYGFLSENAEFSQVCEDYGIKFIGASADMINGMGDKANAKATMKKAGVPTIPGSDGLIKDFAHCTKLAKGMKMPIILKATAGGGGKGMRLIHSMDGLKAGWDECRQEADACFGYSDLYMEKYIEEPRHIEIQLIGDKFGNVSHYSERDCSIQRRHQKLVEETPSPFVSEKLRKKMGTAAKKGAKAIKYEGAGTVEFLVDKDGDFYFMEMNTRIQVEHPITEEVTDVDLIKEQIKVAAGEKINGKDFLPLRHSIECRINAEDPAHGFRPSPGMIKSVHLPGGQGVRVDTHVYAGYAIPPNYDSMIAKLIVRAPSRKEALIRMRRALDEFTIEGIKTTVPFHRVLMDDEKFKSGAFTTSFMESFDMSKVK